MINPASATLGPFAWENWKAHLRAEPLLGGVEIPLYSDAWIIGDAPGTGESDDLDLGPYGLLNLIAGAEFGKVRRSVLLRADDHLPNDDLPASMDRTDETRFHGGSSKDEIAALLSLALGARFHAGAVTRMFHPGGDPKGRPYELPGMGGTRSLIPAYVRPVVPSAVGEHCLNDASILETFVSLGALDAVALVRAARSYQEALWIAETQPQLAWLYLVTAVETAADRWFVGDLDPVAILREHKPALSQELAGAGDNLLESVAREFAPTMKATAKFIGFSLRFLPEAPSTRPPDFAQVDWAEDSLKKAFASIYEQRSKALHASKPFPPGICEPPYWDPAWSTAAERPLFEAAATLGGVWLRKDHPMYLHTYEYIVRKTLLRWWESSVLLPTEGVAAG